MSRTVYRISIVLHGLWLLAANSAVAADSSSDATDDFDRWIPSIGVTLGFSTQEHKGTVDSSEEIVAFGQIFQVPLNERIFDSGQKNLTTIQVGGTVELQTPQLVPHTWSPRLFIGGEILHVSSQKRQIAREGDPSTLREPETAIFPDEAILGQGSATTSDADTVLYGATLGVSIPFEIGDWRISIKPSARYLHQKIDFTGIVLDANREVFPGLPPTITVQIYGDDSLDVHAVGPGLEIEIDAVRVGSLSASVFISGGAYNVLSDRSVSFSNTVQDNQGEGVYRGFWTAKIDPWIYRANAGLRVKWLGFSSGWLGRGD